MFTLALAGLVLALGSSPALPAAVPSEGPTEASESIRSERIRGSTAPARLARGGAHENDLAPPVADGDAPDLAASATPSTEPAAGTSFDDVRAHPRQTDRTYAAGPRSPPPSLVR